MKISTVNYQPQFKDQVLDLFNIVFKKKMSKKFWKWRFETNPFGKPISKLAFVDSKLVAHYLIHPIILNHFSKSINCQFSMTTMTHPNFSKKGLMTHLAKEAYKTAKENNYKLVIAFANKNSHYFFIKKLGFFTIQIMKEMSLNINNYSELPSKYSSSKITTFNESISNFYFQKIKKIPMIITPRTSDYLNWRFIDHPENEYHCFKLMDDDTLAGYFVLKNYAGIKAHIVDFFMKDNVDCYNCMINEAKKFCNNYNLNKITLWNSNETFQKFLKKQLDHEEILETFFVGKTLTKQLSISDIQKFHNWHITMGDSDVY